MSAGGPMDAGVWRDAEVAGRFLRGVRGAIPFANEQIALLLEVLQAGPELRSVLDLGCGDGVLLEAVLSRFGGVKAVGIDFSPTMRDAAAERLGDRAAVLDRDLGGPGWSEGLGRFDAVISGFAIHHQEDGRKREIYAEVLDRLRPGGWFLNLEHVASASAIGTGLWERHMTEAIYRYQCLLGEETTRPRVFDEFVNREDRHANRLTNVALQCDWLTALGYTDVDCFFKCYELALFGGRRPEGSA